MFLVYTKFAHINGGAVHWSPTVQHVTLSKIVAVSLKAFHRLNELHTSPYLASNHVEHAFHLVGNLLCGFFYGSASLVAGGASFRAVDGNGGSENQATVHDAGDTL